MMLIGVAYIFTPKQGLSVLTCELLYMFDRDGEIARSYGNFNLLFEVDFI